MTNNEVIDTLLFVDTNVLFDFYRFPKSKISMEFLNKLEECKDRLITGSQVEMEYKKNRQGLIVNVRKNFPEKLPQLTTPVLFADIPEVKEIAKKKKELMVLQESVLQAINEVLIDPLKDPVYQTLERLFKHEYKYNLTRNHQDSSKIYRLARKRFILGQPPRKQDDTSMGDAINWEWIVQCSISSGKHIVIVTRDADYGAILENGCCLNDWLKQEFSERSPKCEITLTDKLSVGLTIVHAAVTKDMEDAEQQLHENQKQFEEDLINFYNSVPHFESLLSLKHLFPEMNLPKMNLPKMK